MEDLRTFVVVRRVYIIEKESYRSKVDREFDVCRMERSEVECASNTSVVSAVRKHVLENWPERIHWSADVEGLRLYKDELLKKADVSDLTVDKLGEGGEVHVWLREPLVHVLGDSPTTYECMET